MKKILLAGNLPYMAVVILCAVFFTLGQLYDNKPQQKQTRIAVAEKGAIILEAVLEHQDLSKEEMEAQITKPIKSVLQKYLDMGFLVIDTSKDDHGAMSIAVLPSDVIDITEEMRAALPKVSPEKQASAGVK